MLLAESWVLGKELGGSGQLIVPSQPPCAAFSQATVGRDAVWERRGETDP